MIGSLCLQGICQPISAGPLVAAEPFLLPVQRLVAQWEAPSNLQCFTSYPWMCVTCEERLGKDGDACVVVVQECFQLCVVT